MKKKSVGRPSLDEKSKELSRKKMLERASKNFKDNYVQKNCRFNVGRNDLDREYLELFESLPGENNIDKFRELFRVYKNSLDK